jgi:hypothetical protein
METTGDQPPTPAERRARRAYLSALRPEDVRALPDEDFDKLYREAGRLFWHTPDAITLEWLRRANETRRRERSPEELDGCPVFLCRAVNDGTSWAFWCSWCAVEHIHGAVFGHRTAHCHDPRSPFDRSGYYVVGPEDVAFLAEVRRRRNDIARGRVRPSRAYEPPAVASPAS